MMLNIYHHPCRVQIPNRACLADSALILYKRIRSFTGYIALKIKRPNCCIIVTHEIVLNCSNKLL